MRTSTRFPRLILVAVLALVAAFALVDQHDAFPVPGVQPVAAAAANPPINPRDYMAPDFWLSFPESFPDVSYQDYSFTSEALGRDISYLVVLPPGYADSDRRYPVVYMLHGVGGFRTEWLGYGFVEYARKLMGEGSIQPMILVFPQGDTSYWVNQYPDGPRWSDYVAIDLVKEIDANFRTVPQREARIIAGLSSGGTAAVQIGLHHQSVFGGIGAHAPAIRTFDERLPFFGDESWFAERVDPISIVTAGEANGTTQRIMVDSGLRDDWFGRAKDLHTALEAQGIQHRWWTPDGAHDGFYWFYNATEYLTWYDSILPAQR